MRIITFSFYEKRGRIIFIVSVLEIFIPLKSIKKDEGTYIYYFLLDQKNKKKKFIAVHIDFIVQLARKSRSTEVRHLVPLLSPEVATCQLYIVPRIIQGLDQLRLGVVVNRQVPKWRGSTTTTIDRITQACTCNKVDKVYMFRVCVLYIYFGTSEMGGGIIKRIRCLMFNELN